MPVQSKGDVYSRYLTRVAEMKESIKIVRQALSRVSPHGVYAVDDPRITPPPKDKVYTEMEALIQHFLIHSQGFTVPAGEAYVPIEGPRGEHGVYIVSDGGNRPWRVKTSRTRHRCDPQRRRKARRRETDPESAPGDAVTSPLLRSALAIGFDYAGETLALVLNSGGSISPGLGSPPRSRG